MGGGLPIDVAPMSRIRESKVCASHCIAAISLALLAFFHSARAAETNVPLGRARSFAVLAGSSISSTGEIVVVGSIGVAPGTRVVGIPRDRVQKNTAAANSAQTDLAAAYANVIARSNAVVLPSEFGDANLTPGLYNAPSTLRLSGGLVLDAQGNPAVVFVVQVGSNLIVAPFNQVILRNGARAANVFWQVGGSATLGANSVMKGTIMANESVTMENRATLDGRALARNGDVILDSNVITVPTGGTTNDVPLDAWATLPIEFNPQTGLFEQGVRITNAGTSTNAFFGVAALIRGLPSDVRVYNGNSSSAGSGLVAHEFPLAAGEFVDLTVEFYRASRQPFTQPTYSPTITIPPDSRPRGRLLSIDREVMLPTGRVLIEFEADIGKRYAIQYNTNATDEATWLTADPPIKAAANRVQWIDAGPPKTVSQPSSVGSRLYRVVELP